MIKNVSEILKAFIEKEKKELEEVDMKHMPTIGEAYEDLLERGVNDHTIPQGLNLKVVSGFIKIKDEVVQKQIDCMLVKGEGKKYGKKFIYEKSDVLIIFEVKRRLNSHSLSEGWRHLSDITRLCTQDFIQKVDFEKYEPQITVVGHYFGAMFKKVPPNKYKDIFNYIYDNKERMVFFSFLQDSDLPLRILHTFDGYASEVSFRKAYLDFFEKTYNSNESWRVGLPNIPNLVTTGKYAAIKGTGQPYFIRDEESLLGTVSASDNIAEILIETIWMKISRFIGVRMPWGDDLEFENFSPLVRCFPREEEDRIGWEYQLCHEKNVVENQKRMWEPVVLTDFVDSFINLLYLCEGVDVTGESFLDVCKEHGFSKEKGMEEIFKTDFFALKGDLVYPIYDSFFMGYSNGEGGNYISNDKERLRAWMNLHDKKLGIVNFLRI